MIDNINLEKYVESIVNIYNPLTKPSFPVNHNGLVLLAGYAWDISQAAYSHYNRIMSK